MTTRTFVRCQSKTLVAFPPLVVIYLSAGFALNRAIGIKTDRLLITRERVSRQDFAALEITRSRGASGFHYSRIKIYSSAGPETVRETAKAALEKGHEV